MSATRIHERKLSGTVQSSGKGINAGGKHNHPSDYTADSAMAPKSHSAMKNA